MSLSLIQHVLSQNMARDAWVADNQARGEMVAKYRRYVDGDHDAQMTPEMSKLLRIPQGSAAAAFTSNKCDDVVATMVDRLEVLQISGDTDESTAWADNVIDWNRFDGMQIDVHDSAIRDGDSYVLVGFDNASDIPTFSHEIAWDGISGMLVVYRSDARDELAAAVKVWNETSTSPQDDIRVNVYYPDRIEKFIGRNGSNLERYDDPAMPGVWPIPWQMNGQPLGVPVVHFKNKSRGKGGHGVSELENALPLQDALNRTLHSMVMAAELSAFQIRIAKGFEPPKALTPGMWVTIGANGLSSDQVAEADTLEQGEIVPFISMADFFIQQIEDVTRTPNPKASANLSGEALKQLDSKLLGKVKRFQVKAGNAWEDVMDMAHRVQQAYGRSQPPAVTRWRTQWRDGQLRNDTETINNAVKVADRVGQSEFLRIIAPVYGYDQSRIDDIIDDLQRSQQTRLAAMTNFNTY